MIIHYWQLPKCHRYQLLTLFSQPTVEAAEEGEEKVLCSSSSLLWLWLPGKTCHLLRQFLAERAIIEEAHPDRGYGGCTAPKCDAERAKHVTDAARADIIQQ